jgi:D-aminoacyl-tRNA deacylase
MRCVVQRVSRAQVVVEGAAVGSIHRGLLVLVAAMEGDVAEDAGWIERKLLSLRIFPDAAGKMNLSVKDIGGAILLVSQFTLAADVGKGARPSFVTAMHPDRARAMVDALAVALRAGGVPVETGRFGADMQVELVNDGPVTLWLDSRSRPGARAAIPSVSEAGAASGSIGSPGPGDPGLVPGESAADEAANKDALE